MVPPAEDVRSERPGTVVLGACGAEDPELVDLVSAVVEGLIEHRPRRPVALALWAAGTDGCRGPGRELAESVLPFRQTLAYIALDPGNPLSPERVTIRGASTSSAWRE